MTANRFRPRVSGTGPLEEATFIEVLFSGSASPVIGWTVERPSRLWRPPTDVYETEDNFEVLVEMAGARSKELSLVYAERRLTITGVRHDPSPPHRAYHQLEMQFGEFRVDVDLPAPVAEDLINAHYQDGFLRVILPKLKTHSLPIK